MNGEQSRQSRVNREQNDINANNCRTVNSRQFTHNSSLSTAHSHAFTLAETLIVMGIIGVVAALTIPNVNKNTGRAESITRFEKVYAELNEALDRATAVYGPVKTWWANIPNDASDFEYSKKFAERITEFMKVTKLCKDLSDEESCWCGDYACVILASGASFYYDSGDGWIYLDTNGPDKGKYNPGVDTFILGFDDNYRLWPSDLKDGFVQYMNNNHGRCYDYCGQWIMDNGNMDYLDIDNQGRCKNDTSKVLGYGEGKVQSCK